MRLAWVFGGFELLNAVSRNDTSGIANLRNNTGAPNCNSVSLYKEAVTKDTIL